MLHMGGSKCVASVKIFMGTSIVCEGDVSSAVGVEMPATEAAGDNVSSINVFG